MNRLRGSGRTLINTACLGSRLALRYCFGGALFLSVCLQAATNYVSSGGSIEQAVLRSSPGDTVIIGPGGFNITNRIVLLRGMALAGSGIGRTFITNHVSMHYNFAAPGQGCGILPADNTTIADLMGINITAVASVKTNYYQGFIGTSFPGFGRAPDRAFTNAALSGVKLVGSTDCIYINTTNGCQLWLSNSILNSTCDCIAAGNGPHKVRAYYSMLAVSGFDKHYSAVGGINLVSPGNTVELYQCDLRTTRIDYAIYLAAGARSLFKDCAFDYPDYSYRVVFMDWSAAHNDQTELVLDGCDIPDDLIQNISGGKVTRIAKAGIDSLRLNPISRTQREALVPLAGTLIFQSDNGAGLRVYNGTNWMKFLETKD